MKPLALLTSMLAVGACAGDLGSLTERPCNPGDLECTDDGVRVCNDSGSAWVDGECSADQTCVAGGCGDPEKCPDVCKDIICTPGDTFCGGNNIYVFECDPTGTTGCFRESCAAPPLDGVCFQGECVSTCGAGQKSYLGCEYFAVDLDNAHVDCDGSPTTPEFCNADEQQYAIVVSNPDPTRIAHVIITTAELPAQPRPAECAAPPGPALPEDFVDARVLPPKGLEIFLLPNDRGVDDTNIAPLAFRVASNIPISVYQFNPLENVDVFSNDASMLMPTTAADREYFIMSRPQFYDQLRGFMTVVAFDDEPTTVTVTVSTTIQAGASIPEIPSGETRSFVLNRFDVLNLEPSGESGEDLTGSFVSADRPVIVYSGHEAANAPTPMARCISRTERAPCVVTSDTCACRSDATRGCRFDTDCQTGDSCVDINRPAKCAGQNCACEDNPARTCTADIGCLGDIPCCADHLEEQLFPVSVWGREYVAARSYQRGSETDIWRILAAQDGTVVETDPPVATVPVLNRGEWYEFEALGDFMIRSSCHPAVDPDGNCPIMVGQFLVGENSRNAGIGDPSFMLAVPVRQFRESYVFLAPNKYEEDYITIAIQDPATTRLDGRSLSTVLDNLSGLVQQAPVADGAWTAYRIPIEDGLHTLNCDATCSVMVHGYSDYVSYGYPGGLDLLECKADDDCHFPKSRCTAEFVCVQCLEDADCPLFIDGQRCVGQQCTF